MSKTHHERRKTILEKKSLQEEIAEKEIDFPKSVVDELMEDPEFKKVYKKLEPQFELEYQAAKKIEEIDLDKIEEGIVKDTLKKEVKKKPKKKKAKKAVKTKEKK